MIETYNHLKGIQMDERDTKPELPIANTCYLRSEGLCENENAKISESRQNE